MIPVKFRAYLESKNEMLSVLQMYFDLNQNLISIKGIGSDGNIYHGCHISIVELMQFTGILDCNGKEIYEGDIVEFFDSCYCCKRSSKKEDLIKIIEVSTHSEKIKDEYITVSSYTQPLFGIVKWNNKYSNYEPLISSEDDFFNDSFIKVIKINAEYDIESKGETSSYIKVRGNIFENPGLITRFKL